MARRPLTARVVVLAALLGGLLAPLALSGPAQAAARVTIANSEGDAIVDPTYATTVTVSGRGFQSIKGGYGGIYVFFGTVTGAWQPSKGGQTGRDYFYVPDSESKDNQGFQRFVAFPGSDTADAANGGTIKANGTWSTTLQVPGATFATVDREGKATTIDCRKTTCGIITIGAHGVANSRNETFTPVRFRSLYGGSSSAAPSATATSSASGAGAATPTSPTTGSAAPSSAPASSAAVATGPATVAVDRATAVAGRALTFTASGFRPGEQVVASLDDGVAAVGPLSAGAGGEVAGVLRLPLDTSSGTHVLKVTGAASGSTPTASFAVSAAVSATAAEEGSGRTPYVFLAASLLVLGASVLTVALRGRRARRRGAGTPVESGATHAV